MNNIEVAEQLLDRVSDVDIRVKNSMNKATRDYVIKELSSRFDKIIKEFPHLVDDVQSRIVKYQSHKNQEVEVTDFIHLVEWYSMCLTDTEKDKSYWSTDGKYYSLRMDEVITMFLMARFN